VQQSKSKEQSLLGEPFSIEVALVNSSGLPSSQQTSGKGRRNDHIRHNIDESKLLKIDNDDTYCLFYALTIMRIYQKDYKEERKMTDKQFRDLKNNQRRMRLIVDDLLTATGIDKNRDHYEAEVHCPIIEKYWNEQWPNTFKIFIFSEFGTYRPVYASKNTDEYIYPIIL
jgi:hypothetical protein